jgi:LytR cell envelope-related transcriptional attenuator
VSNPAPTTRADAAPNVGPPMGDGQAPVTTVIVLAAAGIAVIAGFVLLLSIGESVGGSGDAVSDVPVTTVTMPPPTSGPPPSTTTITTIPTTTTVAPSVSKSAATVVVANASGVDRSATAMTAQLAADGYATTAVANATGPRLERSIIYYVEGDPAALAVAGLLGAQIPTAQTLPMPQPPPLDRPLNKATVALILGRDAAGRRLADLQTG